MAMRRNVPTLRLNRSLSTRCASATARSRSAAGRPQRRTAARATRAAGTRMSLTMIESLAAIEPSLVQPVEEAGRELGGNDLVPSESSETLEEHPQSESGAGGHSPPRDPIRGRRVDVPGDQPVSDPARHFDCDLPKALRRGRRSFGERRLRGYMVLRM